MHLTSPIALSNVAPANLTNPQVATAGVASTAARSDQLPGIPAPATPSTQAFGDTASQGAGTGFATDTHKHAMMADPHIEAKNSAGGSANESVTWTVAFAGTPVVVVTTIDVGLAGIGASLSARSTTGATIYSFDTSGPSADPKVKMVIARSAT